MRVPVVVANWKMNGTIAESRALASAISEGIGRTRGVEVILSPPFTAQAAVAQHLL